MSRAPTSEPEQSYGYHGEEDAKSSQQTGPAPTAGGTSAAANRGTRAPSEGSGGVIGSGASTGDGGGPEDFDSDAAGGGGAFPRHPDSAPDEGGDAPKHGSR
jgi:hypothetical protein